MSDQITKKTMTINSDIISLNFMVELVVVLSLCVSVRRAQQY